MTFGKAIVEVPLEPVGDALMGPAEAMSAVLAEYLRGARFAVWGGKAETTHFELQRVSEEWPDAKVDMLYPSASIVQAGDLEQDASSFTPIPLEETLGMFDGLCGGGGPESPQTVLWKHAEGVQDFQLDFWTSNPADQKAIEAGLSALFSPGEERYGVLVGGHPRYFDLPIRYTLLAVQRQNDEDSVYANERRLQCTVRAEADIVRLYRAVTMTPVVRVDTTDPNDPPLEE